MTQSPPGCYNKNNPSRKKEGLPTDLVKSWTLRGTVHVFSREDLALFLYQGRDHHLRPCDTLEADEYITKERKQYFADLFVTSIAAGCSTREALKEVCFSQGMTEREAGSVFNSWGGTIRALCENGTIVHELSEKKSFLLCPEFTPMAAEPARLEMARRYFCMAVLWENGNEKGRKCW